MCRLKFSRIVYLLFLRLVRAVRDAVGACIRVLVHYRACNGLIEAAQDLGCNSFSVLKNVILPLTRSGIVSGITMVFVPSISTFYISQKLGGGSFELIGDAIERQFMLQNNYNVGASISLVMMILILLSLAVMNKFSDEDANGGMMI